MTLRLTDEMAAGVREAAARRGVSQQEFLKLAIASFLGDPRLSDRDSAIKRGLVRPPTAFVDVEPTVVLPIGSNILELLDRDGQR